VKPRDYERRSDLLDPTPFLNAMEERSKALGLLA
jgi:hypothetical protein